MSLFQDVHFAFRMIRKRPAVSAIVVLTLGLGIGANGIFFASFYGFRFSHFGEIWTPLQLDPGATSPESRQVEVIARLRHGTGLPEAQAAMTTRAESRSMCRSAFRRPVAGTSTGALPHWTRISVYSTILVQSEKPKSVPEASIEGHILTLVRAINI